MNINGWDISEAKAKQWNVTPGFSDIKNESEWQRASPLPFLMKSSIGFKPLQVTFLVYGGNRNEVLQNCSMLLARLSEPVRLELDGFSHKYHGVMTKSDFVENPLGRQRVTANKVGKLTAGFSCYEYSEQPDGSPFSKSSSGSAQLIVTNPGNLDTPAVVEITPKIGIAELVINGLTRNPDTGENLKISIKSLTTGNKIILDGETGLFTEKGVLKKDIEIWTLPSLLPGTNTITLSNAQMDISVKYRPRFI